ncbi:hypothetical protein B0O99DRAFT_682639 [Bisporella sp. PMI_857]|nr:hypothetical protein B0O99DRAFT_682639 [Bisporella sp. PMI_857]
MREIYELASYCNHRFAELVSKEDGQTIEEYQQRFWAWANGLAVFAKPYLSLDARLTKYKYKEIREIVLLFLGVLKMNLDFGLKKAAPATSAEPDSEGLKVTQTSTIARDSEAKGALEKVKIDLSVPIYGIDGAISRLEKLAKAIYSASRESLSTQVLIYAENKRDTQYEELVKAVVQYLYPSDCVPAELGKTLCDSILFRYYRIEYQRRRRQKEKLMPNISLAPEKKADVDVVAGKDGNQRLIDSQPHSSPDSALPPDEQQDHRSEADTDTKSTPYSIDLGAFNDEMDQKSERLSDQASSAPQTGKILYPKAPELSKEHGTAECPICYKLLTRSDVEKRKWRNHVNEDLEPYVCISENCAANLRFFATEKLWLMHMKQAHTAIWIRHLHNTRSWVCPIPHTSLYAGETSFNSCDELYNHMTLIHSGSHKHSELRAISRKSEVRHPRNVDTCPLCGDCHSSYKPSEAEPDPEPETLDAEERTIRDSANHARISPFVGRHLKSLAFFALRKLLEEPDDDNGARGSGHTSKSLAIDSVHSPHRADPEDSVTEPSTLSFEDEPRVSPEDFENLEGIVGAYDFAETAPPDFLHQENSMDDLVKEKSYNPDEDQTLMQFKSSYVETVASQEEKSPQATRTDDEAIGYIALDLLRTDRCIQELEDKIAASFVESPFDGAYEKFLPASCISQLITKEVLYEYTSDIPASLRENWTNFVLTQTRTVYAIAVWSGIHAAELFTTLRDFQDRNISDDMLPFSTTSDAYSILNSTAGRRKSYQFLDSQWRFLAPIFTSVRTYNLSDSSVLPFTEVINVHAGGYGRIFKVEIHPAHQKVFSKRMDSREPFVAVKEFNENEQWRQEVEHMQVVNDIGHPHLVRYLSAFTRRRQQYVMLEWANRGSLRDFWESYSRNLDAPLILAVLRQISGLIDALCKLHEVPMRHGDLKPENILVFDEMTFKIADFGVTRIHRQATTLQRYPTTTFSTTRKYEAPETETHRDWPRSRLFDVWSMGCIGLECVIWLLYGSEGLKKLDKNLSQTSPYSGFYTAIETTNRELTATVHPIVTEWIDIMTSEDPECLGSSALGDLLRFVKMNALVISLPKRSRPQRVESADPNVPVMRVSDNSVPKIHFRSPTELPPEGRVRATAADFRHEMDEICGRAAADPAYCFTGKSRDALRLPNLVTEETAYLRLPARHQPLSFSDDMSSLIDTNDNGRQ